MTTKNLQMKALAARIAAGAAAFALALTVAACGGQAATADGSAAGSGDAGAAQEQQTAVTATVEIDASAADVAATSTDVELAEGATAYDALVAAADDVSASETEYGMYVMGINGLAEGDAGERSCWMYAVNGEMAEVGCSEYEVQAGDVITWTYVQDWNEL